MSGCDHGESRRGFLRRAPGLALLGAGGFALPRFVDATPGRDEGVLVARVKALFGRVPLPYEVEKTLALSPSTGRGPFYRRGAPFRGKLTPWDEPGVPLRVSGRVWGLDRRRALAGAILEVFQVGADGEYSDGGGDFRCRARLVTDETGFYEFETVHPVPYEIPKGSNRWRSPHIHFVVGYPGHRTLATELLFSGDPMADVDFNGRPPGLVQTVRKLVRGRRECEHCTFDIVLEPDLL